MKRKKQTGPKPKVTSSQLVAYLEQHPVLPMHEVARHFQVSRQRLYQIAAAAGVSWSTTTHRTLESI